ncbi:MAG: HD domain-containing phosphohydrolase [Myxococcota bacterium]|nr:HD domain-containing phosphohydrolase [Myxococcota bacterium]
MHGFHYSKGRPQSGPLNQSCRAEEKKGVGRRFVLLIDEDGSRQRLLQDLLSMAGFSVLSASTRLDAQSQLQRHPIGVVVADYETVDGVGFLHWLCSTQPKIRCVITHKTAGIEDAVEVMRHGGFDYFGEPCKIGDLVSAVERASDQYCQDSQILPASAVDSLYDLADALPRALNVDACLDLMLSTGLKRTACDGLTLILRSTSSGVTDLHRGNALRLYVDDLTRLATDHHLPTAVHGHRVFDFVHLTSRTEIINSLIFIPILSRNENLGWLIGTCLFNNQADASDETLLTIIGDRIGSAILAGQQETALQVTFQQTVDVLLATLNEKDQYTAGHSERVADLAKLIAKGMDCDEHVQELVFQGARLHDIGKLAIDNAELNKAGPLTDAEYERMKTHTLTGAELLKSIPCFQALIPAVIGHHERLDGTGYPFGLKGDEIPLLARIVAVADAYDAMTSDRTYRRAMAPMDAILELDRCRNRHYDGRCIDALKQAFSTGGIL